MPATFYCTHSLGPLFYATGRRPVRVTGFEIKNQEYLRIHGARNGSAAMEIVELDDGSYFKSLHGNLKRPWMTRLNLFGTRGSIESRNAGEFTVYRENEAATGYNDFDTLPGTFSQCRRGGGHRAERRGYPGRFRRHRGDANLAR